MKKLALATTLLLGLSTAAMADPSYTHTQDAPMREDLRTRDHRMPPRFQRWTQLASGRLTRGRSIIDVDSSARFSKLKLESNRGSLFVDKVIVSFANGQRQVIQLDKQIVGSTMIDLDGRSRQISKIVLVGKGGFRSSFALSAV